MSGVFVLLVLLVISSPGGFISGGGALRRVCIVLLSVFFAFIASVVLSVIGFPPTIGLFLIPVISVSIGFYLKNRDHMEQCRQELAASIWREENEKRRNKIDEEELEQHRWDSTDDLERKKEERPRPTLHLTPEVTARLEREEEERRRREREEEEANKKIFTIKKRRDQVCDLAMRGAIFEITTTSSIRGYLVKELGWIHCECEDRSEAEKILKLLAARKFNNANAITKLSYSLHNEQRVPSIGSMGVPHHYRGVKIKRWEAMACEAIPDHEVDKSPRRWNEKIAVVDGSNVAYWGDDKRATLDAVKVVLEKLKEEDIRTFVVFDANIGFKATDRHLAEGEVKELIGGGVDVEIVEAGTVADRRIVSIAERENAVIVSNDLFKDSRRARHIPKRRGFYIAEYGYAELLPFSRA